MSSPKNYAIVFLALTTAAGAGLAWQQYQELIALRAAQLSAERNAASTPLPSVTIAPAVETPAEPARAVAPEFVDAPPEFRPDGPPRRDGFDRRAAFAAMMENPEVQRLMTVQRKAELDQRYAALFKSLKLSPAQLEAFKNLLVEKANAFTDVMGAARAEGLNPRTDRAAMRELVANAQAEVDAAIRATIGEVGFADYKNYEQTLPQRNLVDQLAQRLSYSSTPLSDSQASQLVQVLATTTKAPAGNAFALPFPANGGDAGTARVTNAAIDQSLGVLAGPQLDALKQLQQEQKAQADLNATLRQLRNNPPATTTTPATPSTVTPAGGG